MGVMDVAFAHYRRQVSLARRIAAEIMDLWRGADANRLDVWWTGAGPRTMALVTGAQYLTSRDSNDYLEEILTLQGIRPDGPRVNPRAFTGIASDGRGLDTLLFEPVIRVKEQIGRGASTDDAMRMGGGLLEEIARTQIADAGRTADGVGIISRPQVTGYVRMLSPPSCARCVILAGKFYAANKGFERHPRCDCRHIPGSENTVGDLRTDPDKYLSSVGQRERERILTKAGARAIDDGADLNQVVNARRGMYTASMFGQEVKATREGTTRRGLAGKRLGAMNADAVRSDTDRYARARRVRLMPEQIYADAERLGLTRDETISVLRQHGYIL